MCCTPIGREETYLSELRFPLIASLFFKRAFPGGQVYVGTTPDAVIPDEFLFYFRPVIFDFRAMPFAISRQLFYKEFISTSTNHCDVLFTGCDVLICKMLPPGPYGNGLLMTYRNHPSMPFCSDLLLARRGSRENAGVFLSNVVRTMQWLPQEIQASWADQIALALNIGALQPCEYDGLPHYGSRIKDFVVQPGDDWLYTPNDFFSSKSSHTIGQNLNDVRSRADLLNLINSKIAIHFKGNRKHLMIELALAAFEEGYIDPYEGPLNLTPDWLFCEALNPTT